MQAPIRTYLTSFRVPEPDVFVIAHTDKLAAIIGEVDVLHTLGVP